MLNKIDEYFKKKDVIIPKEELIIISKLITKRTLKKKEYLYKEGDHNIPVVYILKGCIRTFIIDDNLIEYNRFFAFEDWWVGEYHQVTEKLRSKTSAQALEKTEVIEITNDGFNAIVDSCPVFTKSTMGFYIKSYAKLLEKEELKKTQPTEKLYLDLIKNQPIIIKRIPLYHIASYLGVKSESLSRIKKKIHC